MKKRHVPLSVPYVLAACVLAGSLAAAQASKPGVTLLNKPAEQRVDVLIDGQPFTSYIYPSTQQKPVLYPIRSASGVLVTRGYPMDPRPGSAQTIHTMSATGSTTATSTASTSGDTRARRRRRTSRRWGPSSTRKSPAPRTAPRAASCWSKPTGSRPTDRRCCASHAVRIFGAGWPAGDRRDTTWTAAEKPVTFKDTKEGAFGIRVARALDHPSEQAEVRRRKRTARKSRPDNTGVTGNYIASDGKTGEAVWGTRGPWMGLTGTVEGKPVTSQFSITRPTMAIRRTGTLADMACSPPIHSVSRAMTPNSSRSVSRCSLANR